MPFSALLVDDDTVILETLKSIFETRNFSVSTAISAGDAAKWLAQVSFDLVVTDMRMEKETSGFDVIRQAKARGKHPVVIILSAYPIPVAEWRDAGADAMFMKGGGIFRILDDIERMLKAKHATTAKRD